ncbi:MAG: DUF1080 domain-containing protein [Bacteroidetes bacterium]|nr:DUF1080 domain-containing protein [Bacteroidota bacterium]
MRLLLSFFLTASMALSFAACQPAEEEPMTDDAATTMSDDWITLFDGSGFDHWRGYKQDAMPEGWVIDGDAMYASTPAAGMDVVTRDTFTNFELELQWKVEEHGNSGIMWHVDEAVGDYPWMTGPEYQLLDDAAYNDGQIGKNSAGSNYDVQAPSEAVTKPAMEWNDTRIVVNGAHVEHWLNGVKVVEYEKGSEAHQAAVAQSKWTGYPTYGTTSTGHIAFQGDHGAVWFRDIRIKPLD